MARGSAPAAGSANASGHCPAVFDSLLHWEAAPAGSVASVACSRVAEAGCNFAAARQRAYRVCHPSGRWLNELGRPAPPQLSYTNYTSCYSAFTFKFVRNKSESDITMIDNAVRVNEILEMIGDLLSCCSLSAAIFIFCTYTSLRSVRNKIHRNLFIAMLMQIFAHLLLATKEMVCSRSSRDAKLWLSGLHSLPYLCVVLRCFWETSRTSIFAWMLIEGINIHSRIAVTVFQTSSNMLRNYIVGYGLPILPTVAWAAAVMLRGQHSVYECWKESFFSADYWILNGSRLTTFAINICFLLNVLRVLIVRLRESRSNETQQMRKAVRAALLLLPLLGITNVICTVPDPDSAVRFVVVTSLKSFLLSFQGLFLALMYCFLSKEVQSAIVRTVRRRRAQGPKSRSQHHLGLNSVFGRSSMMEEAVCLQSRQSPRSGSQANVSDAPR